MASNACMQLCDPCKLYYDAFPVQQSSHHRTTVRTTVTPRCVNAGCAQGHLGRCGSYTNLGGRTEDRSLGFPWGDVPQTLEPQRPRRLIGIDSPRSLAWEDAASTLGSRPVCPSVRIHDRIVESRRACGPSPEKKWREKQETRLVISPSADSQGPEPCLFPTDRTRTPMATAAMRASGGQEGPRRRHSAVWFF